MGFIKDFLLIGIFVIAILGFSHGMRQTGITTFGGIFAGIREHLKDPYNTVMESEFFSESREREKKTLAIIISIAMYLFSFIYFIPWMAGVAVQILVAKTISRSIEHIESSEAENR